MRLAPVVLALSLLCSVAPAHAASGERVDALMTEIKVEQSMAQMQQIMTDAIEKSFMDTARREGLTAAQIDALRPRIDALKKVLGDAFAWESLRGDIRQIYIEELTDAEIDAALAFYRSPEGRSMMGKLPVLMQRGAEVGQRRAEELVPKALEEMQQAVKSVKT